MNIYIRRFQEAKVQKKKKFKKLSLREKSANVFTEHGNKTYGPKSVIDLTLYTDAFVLKPRWPRDTLSFTISPKTIVDHHGNFLTLINVPCIIMYFKKLL